MNFLAHIYLSGDNEDVLLGNFIADSVKGSDFNKFRENIKAGILFHRAIDSYTDSNLIVEKSKERLRSKYHKYSGVIVDMFYDHFLAENWDLFSNVSLSDFTRNAYGILLKNYPILPSRSKRILPFMIYYNWLKNYSDFDSLQSCFEGMSRRTTFNSKMEFVVNDLKNDYDFYKQDFFNFFPELIKFSIEYRTSNNL
jgi:acyl carrier protein phosphodiesterase